MKLIITFAILSIINVCGSTAHSIVTVKGNKYVASIVNASYYAFYTIMLVYTVSDFALWIKCLICFVCNLIGVFVVKLIEEKTQKEKLWKVEMALPLLGDILSVNQVKNYLVENGVLCNYIPVGKYVMFNCYCQTKQHTHLVQEVCEDFNGKISAYESKPLL